MKRFRCALRHVNSSHCCFALATAGPSWIACALISPAWLALPMVATLVFWLSLPCRDPWFGIGRRHHWFRQSFFIFSILISLALILFLPRPIHP